MHARPMHAENPYQPPQADLEAKSRRRLTLAGTLFSFQGRIPRRVYWAASVAIVLCYLAGAIAQLEMLEEESAVYMLIDTISTAVFWWISLAVSVKRWHDRDKSGWWVLIGLVPLVGLIW